MFTKAGSLAKTGIILVMYRQKHNLELLYSSLAEQTDKDFIIYFVDNNSDNTDSVFSAELNTKFGLTIEYIPVGANTGFAGGNNIGAKKAIASGCEYIFFLNNDTILDRACIEQLIGSLHNNPEVAAASPIIFFWSGAKNKERVQEFGASADFGSYTIKKNYESAVYSEVEKIMPQSMGSDVLPGAAMMVKTELLAKTGLWEEGYFAYGDEIDLARRIKDAGYTCVVNRDAVLWHNHKWNKENKQGYYFEYYLIQRNKYLYFRKYSLYGKMLFAYIADSFLFPWRLIWFVKVCDLKLGWYYIKGTYAGILGHKGKPNLYFVK